MPQEKSAHAVCLFSFASESSFAPPRLNVLESVRSFAGPIMVEGNDPLERRAANCAVSLVAHGAVIAALLILPLFSSSAPRMVPWMRDMVVIPLPPAKKRVTVENNRKLFEKAVLSSVTLTAPNFPSRQVSLDTPIPIPTLEANLLASTAGPGDILGGIATSKPAPVLAPVLPETLRVVHLGGDVTSSRLLDRLTLAYPQLAKAAHVFGKVVIKAIIDETGKVINARAISGPPLLYSAAVEAVSKERFRPMLLNGAPTRCDLQVQVSFNLSDF